MTARKEFPTPRETPATPGRPTEMRSLRIYRDQLEALSRLGGRDGNRSQRIRQVIDLGLLVLDLAPPALGDAERRLGLLADLGLEPIDGGG